MASRRCPRVVRAIGAPAGQSNTTIEMLASGVVSKSGANHALRALAPGRSRSSRGHAKRRVASGLERLNPQQCVAQPRRRQTAFVGGAGVPGERRLTDQPLIATRAAHHRALRWAASAE